MCRQGVYSCFHTAPTNCVTCLMYCYVKWLVTGHPSVLKSMTPSGEVSRVFSINLEVRMPSCFRHICVPPHEQFTQAKFGQHFGMRLTTHCKRQSRVLVPFTDKPEAHPSWWQTHERTGKRGPKIGGRGMYVEYRETRLVSYVPSQ